MRMMRRTASSTCTSTSLLLLNCSTAANVCLKRTSSGSCGAKENENVGGKGRGGGGREKKMTCF